METLAVDKQVTPPKVDRWEVEEVCFRPSLAEVFISIRKGHGKGGKLVATTRDNLTLRGKAATAYEAAFRAKGMKAATKAALKKAKRV